MMRNMILLAAGLALAQGCENRAEREQINAEKAQQSAAEKANQAQREANEKIAKAQNEATEQQQKAQDALNKQRGDIKDSAQKDLDKVDKKITDLSARLAAPKGKGVDVDVLRSDVSAKRDAVKADLQRVDTATANTIDEVKAALDRDLDALKKGVDDWSSKTSKTDTSPKMTTPPPRDTTHKTQP
jgi:hypothetical protein